MKKDNRVELSNEEIKIIEILEHSLFSGKILTDELNSDSCSLMQVRAEGFFEAISLMAKPEVQYKIYCKVEKDYGEEDIRLHLESFDEEDLFGFNADDIVKDGIVMDEIWNELEKVSDCDIPYNDQVDAAIRNVLERKHLEGSK